MYTVIHHHLRVVASDERKPSQSKIAKLTQTMQTNRVKGFLRDSRISVVSVRKLSPPRIKSASRILKGRLASTLHRKTLAMSLNAS